MNSNEIEPQNDFQRWLTDQGYYRNADTDRNWAKDGKIVSGKELSDKLNEWKLGSRIEIFGPEKYWNLKSSRIQIGKTKNGFEGVTINIIRNGKTVTFIGIP